MKEAKRLLVSIPCISRGLWCARDAGEGYPMGIRGIRLIAAGSHANIGIDTAGSGDTCHLGDPGFGSYLDLQANSTDI